MKDVLVVNSYGGSLLLGTQAAGFPIRGSYEDDGFGMEAQRLNFPDLNFKAKLADWPADDLSSTVVIAHPPCAPFSIMNPMKGKEKYQGATADGFQCHRQVMEYALGNGAPALAIESVPGVLKALVEYQTYADKYGYTVYFLKVNSISFGVPQWRPRVWVIFQKNQVIPHALFGVNLQPDYRKLSSIVQPEGTLVEGGGEVHVIIRRLLEAGVDRELIGKMFAGEFGSGTILQLGQTVLEIPSEELGENFAAVRKAWNLGGLFAAMMPRVLNLEGWAPTILGGSAWFLNGRPLFLEEYNQIMGFPADYKWPEKYRDPRLYLSKGVCPPVATWILQQIKTNLSLVEDVRVSTYYCEPSGVLDLCPKKGDVEDALLGREPAAPKVKKPRQTKMFREPAAAVPRTKMTSSSLASSFLAGLGVTK